MQAHSLTMDCGGIMHSLGFQTSLTNTRTSYDSSLTSFAIVTGTSPGALVGSEVCKTFNDEMYNIWQK